MLGSARIIGFRIVSDRQIEAAAIDTFDDQTEIGLGPFDFSCVQRPPLQLIKKVVTEIALKLKASVHGSFVQID